MYLKQIEVQGFKSFPDKTKIAFGSGLTAIVGPNGSGKSNISDAIRWVLGEQSTKTLRGGKMEDVIFSGTMKRKPVGFAEVSLTIDNTSKILNTDYTEVTVTRRYFRSGESEYYINRQSCRLKDIHELFMDTGLGRDGYSMIGQGRIAEIMAQKSDDRREIFEEAAGISKYRYRKEEAERKLDHTEKNLVRLRDILAELTLQVDPLRIKAEKAKQFLQIYEELKNLEISMWSENDQKLAKKLEDTAKKLEIITSDVEKSRKDTESLYAAAEAKGGEVEALDEKIEAFRTRTHEAEEQMSGIVSQIAVIDTKISNNKENIERLTGETRRKDEQVESLQQQIAAHESSIEEVEREKVQQSQFLQEESLRQARLLEGSGSLSGKKETLYLELSRLEADLVQKETLRNSLSGQSEEDKERKEAAKAEHEEKTAVLQAEESALKTAQDALQEADDTLQSLQNTLQGYELRAANRKSKMENAEASLRAKDTALRDKESRLKLLSDLEREYEGFSGAVKKVLHNQSLSGIEGTVANLLKTEDAYALAIETTLGGALQNLIVSDEAAAKRAISYLKNQNAGRATFLPLSTVRGSGRLTVKQQQGVVGLAIDLVSFDPKYASVYESLLGRVCVVDTLDTATTLAKENRFSFRIVTLDGQLLNAGGSYTGGSSIRSSGILTRANQIAALKAETATLKAERDTDEKELAEIKSAYEAVSYEIMVAKDQQRAAQDNRLHQSAVLQEKRVLLDSLESTVASLSATLAEWAARQQERTEEGLRLSENIAELQKIKDEKTESLTALAAESDTLSETQSALQKNLEDIRLSLSTLESKGAAARAFAAQLKSQLETLSEEEDDRQESIEKYQNANTLFASEKAALDENLQELTATRNSLAEEQQGEQQARLTLLEEKAGLEKTAREQSDTKSALEREEIQLQSTLENLRQNKEQLVNTLWESYELTPGMIAELAEPIEDVPAATKRINVLKQEKRALGSVDVDAIEQYAELSTRHTFLSEQCSDLETSKVEMTGIIGNIEAEMSKQFGEKFIEIAAHFKETFSEIFGGGSGEIVLSDPSDLLGSGIDIRVQPPGKSLKTLTLLSGGEMALCAIALYFAILKVRPAPFCILDEIDAALDDVNVVRFAKYMEKMQEGTQFIVITHRRGTMEQADILYGATMQEQGVTRLLAMNIAEIEKQLNITIK